MTRNRKNNGDTTTDTFPAVGDYDHADPVSAAPSPNTRMVSRPRTASAGPPHEHPGQRTQIEIDATSGERLDSDMAKGLTLAAARRASIRRTVENLDPPGRGYLSHLFGLNLPGRDRANTQ